VAAKGNALADRRNLKIRRSGRIFAAAGAKKTVDHPTKHCPHGGEKIVLAAQGWDGRIVRPPKVTEFSNEATDRE
jgi:hypothetical protein